MYILLNTGQSEQYSERLQKQMMYILTDNGQVMVIKWHGKSRCEFIISKIQFAF